MRRVLVITTVMLAAVLGLVGTATPAPAHNTLIASDPADGARLDDGPSMVTLTFSDVVRGGLVNQVAVTGPEGGQWTEGQVEVRDTVVTTRVRPLGPAGDYIIGYRIVSADGHPVSGEIRFTLTTAGTGTPAPTAAGNPAAGEQGNGSTGVPIWVWLAGAGVLLAAGLALALRIGREKR